jgi:polyhydroxyalkanoate synthesis regulator phasin
MADDQRSVEVAGNALEATVLVHALVLKLVVEGVLTRETATSFVDAIVRLFEEAGPAVGAVGDHARGRLESLVREIQAIRVPPSA